MENQIEDLTSGNHTQSEIEASELEKLKRIALALKKKHETSQETLNDLQEENKILKGQQNLLKQLLEDAHREHEKTRLEFEKTHEFLSSHPTESQTLFKLEEALKEVQQKQALLLSTQKELGVLQNTLEAERESNMSQKGRLEKLAIAIKDRDKRIAELQHYEMSYRKALDQKLQFEATLEQISSEKHTFYHDKERLQKELSESKQHSEQLQRVINHLRERQEEATLEKELLREEYNRSQESLESYKQQFENNQKTIEISHQEFQIAKTNQLRAEEELSSLKEQFKQLKSRTIAVQQELQNKESSLLSSHQIIDQIKFDKQSLVKKLEETSEILQNTEIELSTSKASSEALQRLVKEQQAIITSLENQNEASQRHAISLELSCKEHRETVALLQNDIQEATSWRHDAEEKLNSFSIKTSELANYNTLLLQDIQNVQQQNFELIEKQKEFENLKEQIYKFEEKEEQYSNLDEYYNALKEQLKTSLETIKSLEKREEQYHEVIHTIENNCLVINNDRERLKLEATSFEEAFKQAESLNIEKDNALKLSHHHLAKKVKECSLLVEKNKELESSLIEIQQTMDKTNQQLEDLKARLEQHRSDTRKQEEQADEHIRTWEKKYFEMYEHYQNSERRLQGLQAKLLDAEKKLEKYLQLEAILKNLGLGSTNTPSESILSPHPHYTPSNIDIPPVTSFNTQPETIKKDPPKQESLFDNPNAPSFKRKDHLFD